MTHSVLRHLPLWPEGPLARSPGTWVPWLACPGGGPHRARWIWLRAGPGEMLPRPCFGFCKHHQPGSLRGQVPAPTSDQAAPFTGPLTLKKHMLRIPQDSHSRGNKSQPGAWGVWGVGCGSGGRGDVLGLPFPKTCSYRERVACPAPLGAPTQGLGREGGRPVCPSPHTREPQSHPHAGLTTHAGVPMTLCVHLAGMEHGWTHSPRGSLGSDPTSGISEESLNLSGPQFPLLKTEIVVPTPKG